MSGEGAGLRRINNKYIATGQGRDLFIFQDHGWRSGKSGSGHSYGFLPRATTSEMKLSRTSGSNPRLDASRQHLSLSRSSGDIMRERKERMELSGWSTGGFSTNHLSSSTQAAALPGLPGTPTLGSRTVQKEFVPRWDVKPTLDWTPRAPRTSSAPASSSPDLGLMVAARSSPNSAASPSSRKAITRKPDGGFWTSYGDL